MSPSILFLAAPSALPDAEPPWFRDLNLDQVVAAIVEGRGEHDLAPFFHRPLPSVEAVRYRHEVFRDLERPELRGGLQRFGDRMHRVRAFRTVAAKRRHPHESRRWLLDAASLYCDAVSGLAATLGAAALESGALGAFREHVVAYTESDPFRALAADAAETRAALDAVQYTLRIAGARVTVAAFEDEPDFSADVEALFARFRQGDVDSHLVDVRDTGTMDHVEARIADRVARLFPRELARLASFCRAHGDFVDDDVALFDREAQFYLAYLDHVDTLVRRGRRFCLPDLSADSKAEAVEEGFDLALAASGRPIVGNDYRLEGEERLLVVSGPNQGGKTTFARVFGQLHHLAALGVPVPAARARLFLADRVFTHFEREETAGTLRGRLEDELVRLRDILGTATADSVVVLNEVFASATLADALELGSAVLSQLLERDCLGVCVTFVDELSRLGEGTVSMVAQVSPDDPAVRTFRIERRPADGRAYAWALADKYGLSSDRLGERLGR